MEPGVPEPPALYERFTVTYRRLATRALRPYRTPCESGYRGCVRHPSVDRPATSLFGTPRMQRLVGASKVRVWGLRYTFVPRARAETEGTMFQCMVSGHGRLLQSSLGSTNFDNRFFQSNIQRLLTRESFVKHIQVYLGYLTEDAKRSKFVTHEDWKYVLGTRNHELTCPVHTDRSSLPLSRAHPIGRASPPGPTHCPGALPV